MKFPMKIKKSDNNLFTITCNGDELTILSNALSNIPQAVGDCEYSTLIAGTKEEVDVVLRQLADALDALEDSLSTG